MRRYLFLIVVFIISHPSLFAQISSITFHPVLPAGVSSIQKINRESGQDSLFSSRSFFIRNVIDQSKWNSRSFTLFRQSEEVNLWVDTSFVFKTLPKDSLGSVLDSLFIFLTQKTPPGSLNPNLGIVPLENQIYSPPSDIDGNSRVDFLLTDIQDEFEGGGGFIAGFFDPVNQLEYEKSNQREILYIDSYPTLYYNGKINIGMGAQTMAHEYQHLIHFQFMTLENLEWTAINEGCSELTEYLTGFSPRPIPAFKVNTEKGWSFWDEENVILSYERSSVFMSLFYFRFGLKALRSIIKSEKAGFAGLQEGLLKAGISVYPKDLQVWFAEDWVQRGFSSSGLKSIFPVFWQEEFGFSPSETISQFPGLLNYNLESGGFASLKIQFGRQYSADWHSDKPVKVSLLHQSTTGAANWVKSIEPPFEFTSSNSDDDYYIVFSNPDFGTTEFEKKAVKVTVSLSAQQQSGLFVLKTDDGQPDPFYGSAIFLKCPDSTLAYAFWLEDSTGDGFSGIREVSLLTGFLSEFEGTGVGSSESRQFEIEFRTELEVPEYQVIKVTSSRTYGRLKFESHPVPLNHPVYFLKTKGIWVIVRQTLGTTNPVVLGMDRSGGSNFKILRQDNSITVPVDIFNPEYRLEGMNPMIRLSVVKPVEEKIFQSSPVFTFRNDTTFISFSDLRTDSVDYIRLVITNEKGTYVLKTNWNSSANLEATPDFMVPFYLTGYSLFQLERTVNHLVDVSRFSACFFSGERSEIQGWIPDLKNQPFTVVSSNPDPTLVWGFYSLKSGFEMSLFPVIPEKFKGYAEFTMDESVSLKGNGVSHNKLQNWTWDFTSPIMISLSDGSNAIDLSPASFSVSNGFPNPFNSETQFLIGTDRTGMVQYQIFSVTGQRVKSGSLAVYPGQSVLKVSGEGLASGVYFLRMNVVSKNPVNRRMVLIK